MTLGRSRFETDMLVRPDDLDMNRHVHSSRYLDYVLAARFDQMERCYRMSMQEFIQHGFGWVVKTSYVAYKRPLGLGHAFTVRTWVEDIFKTGVRVHFEIIRKDRGKLSCDGWCDYTMVNLKTGRAEVIPDWIIEKYAV